VKRFALCYQTVVCLSCPVCLSATLVYCGQTVGWIKTKLGTQIGFGPGHVVLDGDPAPPPQRGIALSPIFGPRLLWPNGLMDQDATWYGGRPRPRRHCVRWGPNFPHQKGGTATNPIFDPCLLWPNGCIYQDTIWYGGRPQPRRHCVRWGPSSPSPKGARPQFSANVRCGQRAECAKMPLGMEVGLGPGDFVFDGDPAPPRKKWHSPTQFLARVYCGQTAGWIKMPLDTEVNLGQATLC